MVYSFELYDIASRVLFRHDSITSQDCMRVFEAGLVTWEVDCDGIYPSCTAKYIELMELFDPFHQNFYIGGSLLHTPGIDEDYSRFTWSRNDSGEIILQFAYGFESVDLGAANGF